GTPRGRERADGPTSPGVTGTGRDGLAGAAGQTGSMANAAPSERPVFLYDGDCSFCTTCARFIERRIPTGATVTPWQFADLDALGVTQAAAEEAVIWIAPGRPNAAGPVAIARLLVDAGSYWRPLG